MNDGGDGGNGDDDDDYDDSICSRMVSTTTGNVGMTSMKDFCEDEKGLSEKNVMEEGVCEDTVTDNRAFVQTW